MGKELYVSKKRKEVLMVFNSIYSYPMFEFLCQEWFHAYFYNFLSFFLKITVNYKMKILCD